MAAASNPSVAEIKRPHCYPVPKIWDVAQVTGSDFFSRKTRRVGVSACAALLPTDIIEGIEDVAAVLEAY